MPSLARLTPVVVLLLLAGCTAPGTSPEAADGPFLVALGTAQDGGLPHAGCFCSHCVAARLDPARFRAVSSLALVLPDSDRAMILDVGPDIRVQLDRLAAIRGRDGADRVDRAPVDAVFLTHAHLGHYTGLGFFGKEAMHTTGIPVHCSEAMAGFLRSQAPWSQLVALGNIVPTPFELERPVSVGDGVFVTAFRVPHRDEFADTVAYVVRGPRRSVLFVPDTDGWDTWSPSIEDRLAQVDVALLDGTFYSPDELPGRDRSTIRHPMIADSIARFRPLVERGATEIRFTHLNHSNPLTDPGSEAVREVERLGFGVLDDGERIPL